MPQSKQKIRIYAECAVMVALATVLSLIKIIDMPAGGSVTPAAMLPVALIAYRHGTKYGLSTAYVFAVLQALLGLENFSYVSGFWAIAAVLFFDYLIAYLVIGFSGVFRDKMKPPVALALGVVMTSLLRFGCHFISGAVVWAPLMGETAAGLYSFTYNSYMFVEGAITAAAAFFLLSVLDFRSENVRPVKRNK